MNHYASPDFWESYSLLPARVRKLADRNFALLRENPQHPSLRFKRAGLRYRALAVREGEDLIWFWIGSHAEYDRLLGSGSVNLAGMVGADLCGCEEQARRKAEAFQGFATK